MSGARQTLRYASLVAACSLAFLTLPAAGASTASAGPRLTVSANLDRHAISRDIYGVNFADTANARALGVTVDRWGGNGTTRYNYQTGFHNTGSDWYFENIPPDSSSVLPHDAFIAADRGSGLKSVLTVPLIGWTPKATSADLHPFACGFKVGSYGAQDSTDPYDPPCGNGLHNGQALTGNDPHDTSTAIGPSFVQSWVSALVGTYGTAAHGGVGIYQLDNEPALWNSTHRDVHPQGATYNELLTRTITYAAAVKAADPTAAVLGPGDWGWCAYFYSAADPGGCSDGADRQAHGDQAFAPWYLSQLAAYQHDHGVRLLNYFDEHYYPQSGVALRDAGSAATQALRLRSTRSLWDPTYIDESWISDLAPGGVAVKLIPRMKAWVASSYRGTKTSMTEYNFGGLESLNGAVAEADVLGICGREGLDLATLWGAGNATQPWAYAYRMFRNYDGHGHAFGSTSVRARSFDAAQPTRPDGGQDRLAIYAAVRSGDHALTVILINKTGAALRSSLSIKGFAATSSAQAWRYSGADIKHIVRRPGVALSNASMSAAYPANSITMLVIPHR